MPLYDRRCSGCTWTAVDLWEDSEAALVPCPICGAPTERAWLTKATAIIPDEMDHVQVNGLKHPRRFRSKQEHKRWLKANGYRIIDSHEGSPGSDKSKITSRIATMDPYTLESARILVSRAAEAPATSSNDGGPKGITSNEGVIRYLSEKARAERGEFF